MIRLNSSLSARFKRAAERACTSVDAGKYRVLMLLEDWNVGGTEQYVAGLTRYLKQHEGCEVHLVLLRATEIELRQQERELFDGIHCLNSAGFISLKRLIAG